MQQLKLLPTTTGNLESLLPHIALGTSSGTGGELSSQYNVRAAITTKTWFMSTTSRFTARSSFAPGNRKDLTFPNVDLIRDLSVFFRWF